MNIKILGDRVLIKPDVVKETTKSGLFVTGDARREEIVMGEVIDMGSPKKDVVLDPALKIGAKVTFIKYSASEYDLAGDGNPLMVVRMDDIIAVLN